MGYFTQPSSGNDGGRFRNISNESRFDNMGNNIENKSRVYQKLATIKREKLKKMYDHITAEDFTGNENIVYGHKYSDGIMHIVSSKRYYDQYPFPLCMICRSQDAEIWCFNII